MGGGFQPYSKLLARPQTEALTAMKRGKTIGGANPADVFRAPKLAKTGRPPRAPRSPRPPRAAR